MVTNGQMIPEGTFTHNKKKSWKHFAVLEYYWSLSAEVLYNEEIYYDILILFIVSESEIWQSRGCKSVASQCIFTVLEYDANLC